MILTVQCPECGDKFSLKLNKGDPLPDYCSHCGAYVGPDEHFVPTKMNIGSALGKSGDQVYRQMEDASAVRAEAAGDPSLKITNMKDNLREGDVAAIAPQPSKEYQQQVQALKQGNPEFSPWQANVAGQLAMVKSGPDRTTGARALTAIQGARGGPPAPTTLQGNWGGRR